ncbi:unnamed protein product [Tuber aestivum]|uniref:Uncharacterized protein n=1 Tax=Tuber aestivum TaxID=59557 RepID=A0A292PSR6_9PEZI|nr:unnamed protein product [Tuber aestivum]
MSLQELGEKSFERWEQKWEEKLEKRFEKLEVKWERVMRDSDRRLENGLAQMNNKFSIINGWLRFIVATITVGFMGLLLFYDRYSEERLLRMLYDHEARLKTIVENAQVKAELKAKHQEGSLSDKNKKK